VDYKQVTGDRATPLQGRQPPIRIVHVVTTLNIGGLEKVVLDLVRCRTQGVFSAQVVCLDAAGVLDQRFSEVGVPVETIGTAGSVPRRILKLARRLRQLRPQVLHTHNPQAHLHGAWAGRLAHVPVVVHTKHGRAYPEQRVVAAFSRLAVAWTSRFTAVSEDAARVARDIERVPARILQVIHNGIDVERFSATGTRSTGAGRRAVTVGRLDPIKDQTTLLRAVRFVVDKMPEFQLDVVGDGPSRRELEALRATLGLADHVHFHGYREDVAPYLAAADLFVLSSISEGAPLALLEAMASSLPAVATDVGGIREVIVPGETGYLAPASSPEALGRAMLAVLADPGTLERLGRAARRRVEDRFNLRKVVAQYEHVYLQCLGRHAPSLSPED
jgi:sugar transferase (PEP-CTERM/EpsH1 system associated)